MEIHRIKRNSLPTKIKNKTQLLRVLEEEEDCYQRSVQKRLTSPSLFTPSTAFCTPEDTKHTFRVAYFPADYHKYEKLVKSSKKHSKGRLSVGTKPKGGLPNAEKVIQQLEGENNHLKTQVELKQKIIRELSTIVSQREHEFNSILTGQNEEVRKLKQKFEEESQKAQEHYLKKLKDSERACKELSEANEKIKKENEKLNSTVPCLENIQKENKELRLGMQKLQGDIELYTNKIGKLTNKLSKLKKENQELLLQLSKPREDQPKTQEEPLQERTQDCVFESLDSHFKELTRISKAVAKESEMMKSPSLLCSLNSSYTQLTQVHRLIKSGLHPEPDLSFMGKKGISNLDLEALTKEIRNEVESIKKLVWDFYAEDCANNCVIN